MESKTTMELMETSTEAANSSLGKRKAESQELGNSGDRRSIKEGGGTEAEMQDVEDSGDSRSIKEEGGDPYDSKEWEWGYDSFEDREYFSLSEDEYSDEESNQKNRRYRKQYYGNKGFYVDVKDIPDVLFCGIYPVRDERLDEVLRSGKTWRQHLEDMAKLALEIHNAFNGTEVTFDSFVRANIRLGSTKVKTYVTILAKESPRGPPVHYQVKVQRDIMGADEPIFCRRAPEKIVTGTSP